MKKLIFSFLVLSFFASFSFAETVQFRAQLGITKIVESEAGIIWYLPNQAAYIKTVNLTENEDGTARGQWVAKVSENEANSRTMGRRRKQNHRPRIT